jgi:hypothetical protein
VEGHSAPPGEELSSSSSNASVSSDDDEDGPGLLDIYDDTPDDECAGEWILPSWEPPAWRGLTLHAEDLLDAMVRRGATLVRIEAFGMEYSYSVGLSAADREITLFVGWNIGLAECDDDGSTFVE